MVMATGSNTLHAPPSRVLSRRQFQTVVTAASRIPPKQKRIVVKFGGTSLAEEEKANGTKLAVVMSAFVIVAISIGKMIDELIGQVPATKEMVRVLV